MKKVGNFKIKKSLVLCNTYMINRYLTIRMVGKKQENISENSRIDKKKSFRFQLFMVSYLGVITLDSRDIPLKSVKQHSYKDQAKEVT